MRAAADIAVAPIYARRRLDPPQPWRARAAWMVSQRVDDPDPRRANEFALLDLEGGADALVLVAAGGPGNRGFGLAVADDIVAALDGVELDLIGLRLDAGKTTPAFAAALAALVRARRLDSARVALDFGYDPVALEARGFAPEPHTAAALVKLSNGAGLCGRPLLCDARIWHEAGATEARELALVMASAVAHCRCLEAAGMTLDLALRAIAVLLPFDADVLLGIAKARAIRRLWASLEAACALQPVPLMLHAETSWRMMTRFDPHTNAMRATAAVHAAGLGGADAVTVLPMTLVAALPDAAARRLARNTGRVLLDEADHEAVRDPAAGSGTIETLTEELCARAWTLFQGIESLGGIEACLRDGSIGADLAGDARRRIEAVERFERGIVGTSRFPLLGSDEPPRPVKAKAIATDTPFASLRDAEPFETLRIEAGRATVRPSVFLATLGPPAGFGPRGNLAAGLFAAVGIATRPPPLFARDIHALVAAYRESGAGAACLCGDDNACAADGAAAAKALTDVGAEVLVLGAAVPGATTLPPSGDATLPILRRTLATLLGR